MHSLFVLAPRFLLVFVPWLCALLLADLALTALLPAATVAPTLVYHVSSWIAEAIWRGIQWICATYNQAGIVLVGDPLPPGESAVVVCNHVEWTDFYMIQALALRSGMLGRCRWFAKHQLKWVPFLGWGLWAMGMPLVTRRWTHDKREMDRLFRGIKSEQWPIWLISYSEATRFSPDKYAQTIHWCKANDRRIPKHTLYPRNKGFVATVNNLRHSHVKAVYNVTVAYANEGQFMSPPSFWQTLFQPNLRNSYRMYAHVERHEMQSLPDTDDALAAWLEDRWIAKGERLEGLRRRLVKGQSWRDDSNGHTLHAT